jgi:broad specificity phosphatase PhoE
LSGACSTPSAGTPSPAEGPRRERRPRPPRHHSHRRPRRPDRVADAVLHGGIIGEIGRQATGSRPFAFIHADNASITRLVVMPDGRWLLRAFNDVSHLAVVG